MLKAASKGDFMKTLLELFHDIWKADSVTGD